MALGADLFSLSKVPAGKLALGLPIGIDGVRQRGEGMHTVVRPGSLPRAIRAEARCSWINALCRCELDCVLLVANAGHFACGSAKAGHVTPGHKKRYEV